MTTVVRRGITSGRTPTRTVDAVFHGVGGFRTTSTAPGTAVEVTAALISAGADPTPQNDTGKTAFDYARSNGALLESGILERLAE